MSDREPNYEQGADERPGIPLDPLRLWLILKRRWQIVVVATVIGAFLGAAVAKKVVQQTFEASGVLQWAGRADVDPVERQTTIEALTLPSLLELVKKRMGLKMPAQRLRPFLTITSSQQSNNIQVVGNWGDAEGAAKLVNTLMDTFLEEQTRMRKTALVAQVERMRMAVASAEAKAHQANEAYEKFRTESGISDISQERELAIQRAAELSAQSDVAKAQAASARAELERLKTTGGTASPDPKPATDALEGAAQQQRQGDQRRLAEARRALDAARVQYSADHPNVKRLEAEVGQLESRLGSSKSMSPQARMEAAQRQEAQAAQRQRTAEEYAAQVQERLSKLSAAEGRAAVLLGELTVTREALASAKGLLTAAEIEAQKVESPFRLVERATVPQFAVESKRRKVAVGVPIAFFALSLIGVLLWGLRRFEVRTPSEAAFWSHLPVVGATTWPLDGDMLASLMHDLDDFAPAAVGVTLIIGVSLDEAPLARKIAQWEGQRKQAPTNLDEVRRLGPGADVDSSFKLALRLGEPTPTELRETPSMQILTLNGPVPAQALRRAARLADRVLVVVLSGRHSMLQLTHIRGRLGRDTGIGLLLVGLEKDFAMVRDRIGPIDQFWATTRSRAET